MESRAKVNSWLSRNGVYNAIVVVDGKKFRVNATLGILPAQPEDQWIPQLTAPEWIETLIRESLDSL